MEKKCKIVMLSTDKAEKCLLLDYYKKLNNFTDKKDSYFTKAYLNSENMSAQHLYIISDDKIKKGDKVIQTRDNETSIETIDDECEIASDIQKKIIVTTDNSLKISSWEPYHEHPQILLPQLSQTFIEKYIEEYNKGNIITDVLVEYKYVKEELVIGKEYFLNKSDWKVNISYTKGIYLGDEKLKDNGHINVRANILIDKDKDIRIFCDKDNLYIREQLKINLDNTIIVKPVKDSWMFVKKQYRNELKILLIDFITTIKDNYSEENIRKWIEKNL